MSNPLLSDKETAQFDQQYKTAVQSRIDWQQCEAIREAHRLKQIKQAQSRPDEYLNGLLILVGSRGTAYLPFEEAFSRSDESEVIAAVSAYNTPESRRHLYTILRALSEIPKTWAKSAFGRFLRGIGKQKDSKYHGVATFGVDYGWKGREVDAIVNVIAGRKGYTGADYCDVLMQYRDMHDEITGDANRDYDVVEYGTEFVATSVDRDLEFIQKCCESLEKQGLGPVPQPRPKKAKQPKKVKQFKSGDIVRKRNLSDLPLPAHVQIPIQRWDEASKQWLDGFTIEQVILALGNTGRYQYALVEPGTNKAYQANYPYASKVELEGATYLGPFTGKIIKKTLQPNFRYRTLR